MLDGRDFLAVDPDAEIKAAGDGNVVNQNRAAATQALTTAFARAEEIETLQQFDEVAMRLDRGRDWFAVQCEIDDLHAHGSSNHSSSRGRPSLARNARSTASAVIGNSMMRTPMASWIALAIAGDTPNVPDSPSPLAPNGPVCCSAVTSSLSIGGMSPM